MALFPFTSYRTSLRKKGLFVAIWNIRLHLSRSLLVKFLPKLSVHELHWLPHLQIAHYGVYSDNTKNLGAHVFIFPCIRMSILLWIFDWWLFLFGLYDEHKQHLIWWLISRITIFPDPTDNFTFICYYAWH